MNTQVPEGAAHRPIRCPVCGESTGVYWSSTDRQLKVMLHDDANGKKCPGGGVPHPGDDPPAGCCG